MTKTIKNKLKVLLIIVSFTLTVNLISAQGCPPCSGITQNSTFTTGVGTFSIDYKDCGGVIEIINITCNGATVRGSILFSSALYFFFQNNTNVQNIMIPATCMKWSVPTNFESWYNAGYRPDIILVPCTGVTQGCCVFNRDNNGLLEQMGIEAPMCGTNCFEVCAGS